MSLPEKEIKEGIITTAKDNPLVSYFCHKNNLHRSTYYRWIKKDKKFREDVRKAQKIGRQSICDLAESKIIQLVKSSNENVALNASKYLLNNNHMTYKQSNWGYQRIKLEEKMRKIKSAEDHNIEEALDFIKALIKQGQREQEPKNTINKNPDSISKIDQRPG
jgi:hypothetical protein